MQIKHLHLLASSCGVLETDFWALYTNSDNITAFSVAAQDKVPRSISNAVNSLTPISYNWSSEYIKTTQLLSAIMAVKPYKSNKL